jgi:uncharacterized protein YrzB (UPF0473 family)
MLGTGFLSNNLKGVLIMSENMELEEVIVLEDEEGNEIEFELADKVVYEGHEYVVLLPLAEDDSGIVILEVEEGDGEEGDLYMDVEDEAVLNAVFDMFKEKYADEYDFMD